MKNKTHIYMANLLIKDLRANKITLPGLGTFIPPEEIRLAILNNQGAFRAGAVGPDFYPDLLLGQATIHPDNSGEWIDLMFKRLRLSVPAERERNLAFTLGFMIHYAGDMFGHAFVNSYALGWFPPFDEVLTSLEKAKIVIRHMLVEKYMDDLVPNQSIHLSPPINFIRDVFTCGDAQDLMRRFDIDNTPMNPLGMFINIRNKVHNDLLRAVVGFAPGPITKFFQNWEEDVDKGIRTWLEEWAQTSSLFAGESDDKFRPTMDRFERWFLLRFTSMIGFPDAAGAFMTFLSDIKLLNPLKDLIKELQKKILIAIAKAVLGKENYAKIEDAVRDLQAVFKDPKTYLNNTWLFPQGEVSDKLDADFGNFGKESSTNRQTFHAFYQCLNMCKLCLIGSDNLNEMINDAGGRGSYRDSTFLAAARMGYITVKTSSAAWSGTDNNIYLGITYGRREYEVLCDKMGYNDFEKNDLDTYPFFLPENVELSRVGHITARMSGHTPAGGWKCDWIQIKDRDRKLLFQSDADFWLYTGNRRDIHNFDKKYSISEKPLRLDPSIMNFLWSLDGKGDDNSNPARKKQWELSGKWRFPFYSDTLLRAKIFRPLFETPADPLFPEDPYADDYDEEEWDAEGDYCVNKNHQGRIRDHTDHHELHKLTCSFLPDEGNRIYLGYYNCAWDVLEAARDAVNGEVDGCYYCCRGIHKQ
jgi:hypothetical protein